MAEDPSPDHPAGIGRGGERKAIVIYEQESSYRGKKLAGPVIFIIYLYIMYLLSLLSFPLYLSLDSKTALIKHLLYTRHLHTPYVI